MEATTLCFRLLMLEFLLEMHIQSSSTRQSEAALLRVDPNRLQHFDYESLTFHCEGTDGSIKLKGTRNGEEFRPVCEIIKTSSSSCTIFQTYQTDNGEYWCESGAGKRSNRVNITITAGPVILDSPALPVFEGDDVTLRCKSRNTSTKQTADFYKGGVLLVERSPADQMTVHSVSKSDEGFYKCSIAGVGTSPESFLAVGANTVSIISPTPHEETLSDGHESSPDFVPKLVPPVVLLLLLLVAFIYCRKRRASSKMPAAASNLTEAASAVSGAGDDEDSLTYAVVFTKRRQDKVPDAADAGDNLSCCLESNHSRNPATEEDADESSLQPVYSTLKEAQQPESGLRGSTLALNPTAALEDQEIIYSAVQTKQRAEKPD